MNSSILAISGISIKQDSHGRFCLNDLHKSAGGEKKHQPANWLRMEQTSDLIMFLESEEHKFSPVETVKGRGKQQGTFVVKELVYAYATWISAKFFLTVIRAYDSLVNQKPYGLKLSVELISPAQCQEIRRTVAKIVNETSRDYQTIYWSLHEHFNVNKYDKIPAAQFDDAIEFLTGKKPVKMVMIPESELESLRLPNPKVQFQIHKQEDDLMQYTAFDFDNNKFAMIPIEKWDEIKGELVSDEILKSDNRYTVKEIAEIFNEIPSHDLAIVQKSKIMALKKALANVF